MEVATGLVKTGHYKRRRRREFLDFMNEVVAQYPQRAIHVVLDNLNTHKPKRDLWLAILAHEIGEPFRQFALVGPRIGPIQHVRDDQSEHVVAEEFQPLIAVGAMTGGGLQRGDMRKRGRQQRGIGNL